MSNSGSGAFVAPELYVSIPLRWVLEAIGHLEDGDTKAQSTAKELAGYIPRIPTAHLERLTEGRDDDGVAEE